ncbi:SAM-dependent methyltransferase [Vibrio sp. vnigr-6D03]|uniref:class I SAM-dependent methyltransferase n=1 Tax=Vibrio sp. vnigr-6D03 TaxID=2058088 RepID=UPI000C33BC90|nr:methyltransferase domain-containing protein [Vibrio sp. vnigr-6D03]PKF80339.1 SAM-dependent methyltransferase [Vibrio sp. vnigr-6D03]
MDENTKNWRIFYKKALSRPHAKRTELATKLNESKTNVAIDCGCGTGSDIDYLEQQGYQVHGFDVNPDSIDICLNRFKEKPLVNIKESSFESYDFPCSGVVIANSSLFFADPTHFNRTWEKIEKSIEIGGVFAGDFMGVKDSWASNFRQPTTPLSEQQVRALFVNFEIVRFIERDEASKTTIGILKHWHTYSVVAVKRT